MTKPFPEGYEWPVEVPIPGVVASEIATYLASVGMHPTQEQLQRWRLCMLECAALLDPDNPPLTKADLARMKRREPR